MQQKIGAYYQLAKPGVTYGNVLSAVAGFFLAAAGQVNWGLFLAMISGMTLVIGGACALNNYYDRDIDSVMARTKKRPSVTGAVSPTGAWLFAIVITMVGLAILALWTNWLTVIIGAAGFVIYVWLYGVWTKRTTVHGTAVGAISGALPIVGGYTAVTNTIDAGAIILFLIIFFWQFSEFYSISIYRLKEYAKAKVPLMSVVYGVRTTIIQIYIYTFLYVVSTLSLTVIGYTGYIYLVVMTLMGLYWLNIARKGLHEKDSEVWARRMFKFSMTTILVLCIMLSVGSILP
ncbi:MAG: heme o synthase [Candidatus Saccharimonadales bacterium]